MQDDYTRQLQSHDWFFQHSDDAAVWRRGRDERAELLLRRHTLDPDGVIWNNFAPAEFHIHPLPPQPDKGISDDNSPATQR